MWDLGYLLSVRAEITFPRQLKEELIFLHSWSLFPVAPVTLTLSLPAKSTIFNFPTLICLWFSYPFSVSKVVIYSTIIIKTAWLLEETSFILVLAVALDYAPFCIKEKISLGFLTAHSDKPSTKTPLFLSSLISKFYLSYLNKSLITSL